MNSTPTGRRAQRCQRTAERVESANALTPLSSHGDRKGVARDARPAAVWETGFVCPSIPTSTTGHLNKDATNRPSN